MFKIADHVHHENRPDRPTGSLSLIRRTWLHDLFGSYLPATWAEKDWVRWTGFSEDIRHFRANQAASRLGGAAAPLPAIVGGIREDIW